VDPHFIPNYNPWEQRFVLRQTVIFLKPLEKEKAVVTDQIDRFISNGIVLKSGQTLEALHYHCNRTRLSSFGGVKSLIDSQPFDVSDILVYKGLMLSDLPNFFILLVYPMLLGH
jgi:cation diffusion facilitator CzcD-associated flavoprotein CzcO